MRLRIEHLSSWYGQAQALWDVDINVDEGEIVGVLGRNGAGKTTLMRAVAGLCPKVRGNVTLGTETITGLTTHQIALAGVSLLREAGQLSASLTVAQNLGLARRLARARRKEAGSVAEVLGWFPLLARLTERKAGLLSGGQRQALALAMAFVSRPSLLLLDEPSAGLAPLVAKELYATIGQLAGAGMTVLVVEQHPAWLSGLVNRSYLLEMGRVKAQGSLEEIITFAQKAEA